jgi:hypothetical protein
MARFGDITDPLDPRLYSPRSDGLATLTALEMQAWFVWLRAVDLGDSVVVAKLVPGDYLFAARRIEWVKGGPLYVIVEEPPPPPEPPPTGPEVDPTIILDPHDPRLRAPRSDGLPTLTAVEMQAWFTNLRTTDLGSSIVAAKNEAAMVAVSRIEWITGGPLYLVVEMPDDLPAP